MREAQAFFGTLKFYYTQTEFLFLIVRSIYLEEADLHWKLRLIFTICFLLYFIIHDIHKIHNYMGHYLFFSLCIEFHTVCRQIIYFFDVTYYIKVLTNETGKFMLVRSEEADLRLLKKVWKANHRWADNIKTDLED